MTDPRMDEVTDEVLHILREEGYDSLADDFATAFRRHFSRSQWLLGSIKTLLFYFILLGLTITVPVGFIHSIHQGDYLGAILILALGCILLLAVAFLSVVTESFREYLLEEGIGSDRTAVHKESKL